MAITVEKVITKRQTREFIKFPYALYKNDKNWVPPLLMDDYRKINRRSIPSIGMQRRSSSWPARTECRCRQDGGDP